MSPDPWLVRWLPLITERSAGLPILELGCGSGEDTAVLVAHGQRVVALDLSAEAIAAAAKRVPDGAFLCRDLRHPFPVAPGGAGVILASLSLHYFPWNETRALVERIRDTLGPGGVLLCRLNSTRDHHYGASGHPAIEANYYDVDGQPKRFFDRCDIERLFDAGWHVLGLEEHISDKYDKPKALWEVILEKSPTTAPSAADQSPCRS